MRIMDASTGEKGARLTKDRCIVFIVTNLYEHSHLKWKHLCSHYVCMSMQLGPPVNPTLCREKWDL